MGNGVKWAEEIRPDMDLISKRLDDRVPKKVQNIFLQDLQNDCDCSIETYDSGIRSHVVYLSKYGVYREKRNYQFPLPMLDDISEQDVIAVLRDACSIAKNESFDISYNKMLYNPEDLGSHLDTVWRQLTGRDVHIHRGGDIADWIAMDFVPKGTVYIIPDPEFFGAISVNIDKFGVFCYPSSIIKLDLKDVKVYGRRTSMA